MSTRSRQRDALIAAGRSLALRATLEDVDALRLCSEARLPPEAFEQHFGSMTEYLVALQQVFMNELRDRLFKVTAGMPTSLGRIKLAVEVYLEGCLAERALRNWLLPARNTPEVADGLRRQNEPYWLVIGSELKSLGGRNTRATARVFVSMVNETAQAEHRMGQAQADLRETLWDFLERSLPPPPRLSTR